MTFIYELEPYCLEIIIIIMGAEGGGALKTRDWKTRHQTAGVENAGLENAGV